VAGRADKAKGGDGAPASGGGGAPKASVWGDLNKALNGLVRSGVIAGYTTGKVGKGEIPPVEVSVTPGADQAEVVRQVRAALPEALAETQIRTRADG
jgi:hypothetical protein